MLRLLCAPVEMDFLEILVKKVSSFSNFTKSYLHVKCCTQRLCTNLNVKCLVIYSLSGYSSISFLATFSANTLTPTNPMVFDDDRINTGGHYDPIIGIYTVPIDGTYEFISHVYIYNDTNAGAFLEVDNILVDISKSIS